MQEGMTQPQNALPGMDAKTPHTVGVATIARLYGVTERSVQIWVEKKYFLKVGHDAYPFVQVIRGVYEAQLALINRKKGPEGGEELEQAELREQKAKADKAEIEVKRLQGELISAEEVKAAAFERARLMRDTLENIPSRISASLAAETDEVRIKEIISKEINQALEEMSR